MLCWYKALLTGLTFSVAFVGGNWGSQTYDEVGSAAWYAFSAAVCLVVGMVSTGPKDKKGMAQAIDYVNRSVVAALTLFAGWQALQKELAEASLQAIVPPMILTVIMGMAVLGIWVGGLKQMRRCDHSPCPPTGPSTDTGRASASKPPSSGFAA